VSFTVHKDVMVAMRDGVELATDLWVPDATPAPTLLVRLPYSKDLPGLLGYGLVPNLFALVEAGYAVVYQDCRGTFRSAGDFTPMLTEADDGADTVAWVLDQPWCDGAIGTYGPSYLGFVQWASVTASDRVRAIAPCVTTTDYYTTPWYSDGGALSWHSIQSWSTQMALAEALRQLGRGTGDPQLLADLSAMLADPQPHLEALPPSHQPVLEKVWPWWSELLSHPSRDQFWQDLSVLDGCEQVTVPALHIGGWFDIFAANTARSFTELRSRAGTAEAREGQRLIIGPWDHLNSTGIYPDRRFGLTADAITQDLTSEHLKFFDRWLRGRPAARSDAPVKIFVMGIDQWREEQDWPLPDTSYESWYLHGRAGPTRPRATDGSAPMPPPAPPRTPISTTRCGPCPPSAAGSCCRPPRTRRARWTSARPRRGTTSCASPARS
jgi:putative CocE/NonD family hydrolase